MDHWFIRIIANRSRLQPVTPVRYVYLAATYTYIHVSVIKRMCVCTVRVESKRRTMPAEIMYRKSPSSTVRLPLMRSFFSVLVAALGSSSAGYALAYPSSALLDLAELPDDRAFHKGNTETLLFGVLAHAFRI